MDTTHKGRSYDNSCMYILPANHDKFYNLEKPLVLDYGFPGDLTDIRALPAEPKDVLVWTQTCSPLGIQF